MVEMDRRQTDLVENGRRTEDHFMSEVKAISAALKTRRLREILSK